METILSTALAGGLFCLLGGQPLLILGGTGPLLLFERFLLEFCENYDIYYITFRAWIGLWCAVFCIAIVAANGSVIVRFECHQYFSFLYLLFQVYVTVYRGDFCSFFWLYFYC